MPEALTVTEIGLRCDCSKDKVLRYIRRFHIVPVGECQRGTRKGVALYEFTPLMDEYLHSIFRPGPQRADTEAERIKSGWLTLNEIADKWKCSVNKAMDILLTSHAEDKWEGGSFHLGRRFWKIPEKLCRDPSTYKQNQKTAGDWLANVPEGDIRDMIMDERRGKALVGQIVAVKKEKKTILEGKLISYNMVQFVVQVGEENKDFMTKDTKVVAINE